ncbi:unnamed protein product [Schistosoma spindalis]|nr:unnamed protein product [Schistosoma spindale]
MTRPHSRVLAITFVIVICILCSTYIYNNHKRSVNIVKRKGFSSELQYFDIRASSPNSTCRHTKQSPILVVDELGYLCNYFNLLTNSCCPFQNLTQRFFCHSCKSNHCCSIYEHCVSCCLNPINKSLWDKVQNLSANNKRHLQLATDAFEFCVAVCRTSSLTVLHENRIFIDFINMLSLDHCKNLAYYLLTTNYAPYQNEKLKHLFDNINNDKSRKTQRKPLLKAPTTANTTNSVTVNISSYGDNSLPVLSKNIQQKKHYNFLIKMLKRDSLLPESLWNNVYNQLCDNFVYELNSLHRGFHQLTSTSTFVNYVIQYLGRSFSMKHNIIQLTDIGLSESFKHNNIDNTSVDGKTKEQILSHLTEALANTLLKYPIHLAYKRSPSGLETGISYVSTFRKQCKEVLEYCLSHFEANYLVYTMRKDKIYNLSNISTNDNDNDDDNISSSSYTNSMDNTHYNNYSIAELVRNYDGLQEHIASTRTNDSIAN